MGFDILSVGCVHMLVCLDLLDLEPTQQLEILPIGYMIELCSENARLNPYAPVYKKRIKLAYVLRCQVA